MSNLEKRLERLEERLSPGGEEGFKVWYPESGEPKPEVGEGETLFVVRYDKVAESIANAEEIEDEYTRRSLLALREVLEDMEEEGE